MVGSKSVFLSYASQDSVAAATLGAALRAAGIEVWFDQNELRGGDVWDQNIRQRIRDCTLFVPLISHNASARNEGYFRLEWKLAVDRSHLMAPDQPFIVPVIIDDTAGAEARVPERFHEYQWTRLPAGAATPAFVQRIGALAAGTRESTAARAHPPAGSAPPHRSVLDRWPRVAAIAAGALLLAVASWFGLRHSAIVPYSAQDRRMTFAVLPFVASASDPRAVQVAAANTDACTTALEENSFWAHAEDRSVARDIASRVSGVRNIARAIDVHFLIRGVVSRTSNGYAVEVSVLDGETERVLGSKSLTVMDPALSSASLGDYDSVLGYLIYNGLQAEVQRARARDERDLDVRDLTFRAYSYYNDHHGEKARDGYETAQRLLDRALALSHDDRVALTVTAKINLCDCLEGWMHDTTRATSIGAAAVDRLTRLDPQHPPNRLRLDALQVQHRWAEMLSVSEQALRSAPDDGEFLTDRVVAFLHLGRADEALAITPLLERRNVDNFPGVNALIADTEYAAGRYEMAAQHAETATASMSAEDLRSPSDGTVRLTLVAAHARLGNTEQAHANLQTFWESVPAARTISEIRRWMNPAANLYGYEPLFAGLSLAGIPD